MKLQRGEVFFGHVYFMSLKNNKMYSLITDTTTYHPLYLTLYIYPKNELKPFLQVEYRKQEKTKTNKQTNTPTTQQTSKQNTNKKPNKH